MSERNAIRGPTVGAGLAIGRLADLSFTIKIAKLIDGNSKLESNALRLVEGAPAAIRWTKYALNNWLRSARPPFDASLALEFLSFTGPDVKEGAASIHEKRPAEFNPIHPFRP